MREHISSLLCFGNIAQQVFVQRTSGAHSAMTEELMDAGTKMTRS
jgi:hypothetical protein